MDLPQSINLNRTVIARIVAGLFALLGLTDGSAPGRISSDLHRSIARVLLSAESAVRRLIVFLAKSIQVKSIHVKSVDVKVSPARPMPSGIVGAGQGNQRLSFQLFDPRQRIFRPQRQPKTARPQPRISFFGDGDVRTISWGQHSRNLTPPPKDDQANPENLVRRLQAVKAALDNLPRQARRLVRALARRQKSPRLKFKGPLRPGHAPGYRKRPREDIDHVLRECDWLAREAFAPDTS